MYAIKTEYEFYKHTHPKSINKHQRCYKHFQITDQHSLYPEANLQMQTEVKKKDAVTTPNIIQWLQHKEKKIEPL